MKYFIYIVAVIVVFGLEVGIFTRFPLAHTLPELILVMVVYFSIKRDDSDPYVIAVTGGLLMDIYASAPAGSFTLAYVLIVLIARLVHRAFAVREVTWKHIPFIVLGGLMTQYVWIVVYNWLIIHAHWVPDGILFSDVRFRLLPQAVYTIVLLYPMLTCCAWLDQMLLELQRRRHTIT